MAYKLLRGTKATNINNVPTEAWESLTGANGATPAELKKLFGAVAWLYRGVQLIANNVSSMPFDITRGGEVVVNDESEDWPTDLDFIMPHFTRLTSLTAESVTLDGKGYWFIKKSRTGPTSARWILPSSVKPKITGRGLSHLDRRLPNRATPIRLDVTDGDRLGDAVYFWLPDSAVEIGPPKNTPGRAAMAGANVLFNMDTFLAGYFEDGLIKATVLTYQEAISPDEAIRVKEWWQRVAAGVRNAFASMVLRSDFKPHIIGEGIEELGNETLSETERENIAVALGVPQTKLSKPVSGLGDNITPAERGFIEDTIIPLCGIFQAELNRQLFVPLGYRLKYRPERLSIMQTDETNRSAAVLNYVNAGMPLASALEMLGATVPEGMPVDGGQRESIESAAEAAQLRRWLSNRPGATPDKFNTQHLTRSEKWAIYGETQAARQVALGEDYEKAREAFDLIVEQIKPAGDDE